MKKEKATNKIKKGGCNQTPQEQKAVYKAFKEYSSITHLDLTYNPKLESQTTYLFVAIEDLPD